MHRLAQQIINTCFGLHIRPNTRLATTRKELAANGAPDARPLAARKENNPNNKCGHPGVVWGFTSPEFSEDPS